MNYDIFASIFDSSADNITAVQFIIAVAVAIALGFAFALLYRIKNKTSDSFFVALSVLPSVVCVVILMVNGNIGAGVAVAGAFGLVRFRSAQGNAREICGIFIAMGIGLVMGMGYVAYAVLFTLIMGGLMVGCNLFVKSKKPESNRVLTITMPESLDYNEVFNDVFDKYLAENELLSVKTTNLGSLFKLKYNVKLKNASDEKKFIDELRVRNGNLEISVARAVCDDDSL